MLNGNGAAERLAADGTVAAVERRDENGIFKDLAGLVDLGEAEPQLTVTVT